MRALVHNSSFTHRSPRLRLGEYRGREGSPESNVLSAELGTLPDLLLFRLHSLR